MRVAFLGRGNLGIKVLNGLLSMDRVEVVVIVACAPSPDVPVGEDYFRSIAKSYSIPFYKTNSINSNEFRNILLALNIDLAVAMLWLYTISEKTISTAKYGFLNLHGGDLPRYRGNACQTWAILNEETQIGITCHLMEGGVLDSGSIIRKHIIDINPDDAVGDLIKHVYEIGSDLVLQSVDDFLNDNVQLIQQDNSQSLRCYPRLPRDGEIDWSDGANDVRKLIRAANRPYPGAYSWYSDRSDEDKIKKLTIFDVSIETHREGEFCAVPGHILRYKEDNQCGVVCGDGRVLILNEIEIDGHPKLAIEAFRSIRQRLGLDVQSEIAYLKNSLIKHKGIGSMTLDDQGFSAINSFSQQFPVHLSREMELLEGSIVRSNADVGKYLQSIGASYQLNALRNYSFQKRFYDWEQRIRWFGLQLYQSLTLLLCDQSVNIGIWYWGDNNDSLEQRIYISINNGIKGQGRHPLVDVFLRVLQSFIAYSVANVQIHDCAAYAKTKQLLNEEYPEVIRKFLTEVMSQ
jgi:methionyl-tRNA formyltransferase